MAENADMFRSSQQQQGQQPQASAPATSSADSEHSMRRYEVNVIVDNSETSGAPVVHEFNPTYTNLMGRVDKEARYGALPDGLHHDSSRLPPQGQRRLPHHSHRGVTAEPSGVGRA